MMVSRRGFIKGAGAVASLALVSGSRATPLPFSTDVVEGFQPHLLPSVDEVWDWQVWMNNLGAKFTGNPAHKSFVEFLSAKFNALGLEVTRDTFKFTRWDARDWSIKGPSGDIPTTSYYPYSGRTGKEGVTGQLLYAGEIPLDASAKFPSSGDLKGKIVFADFPVAVTPYNDWYKTWGFNTPDVTFPNEVSGVWGIRAPQLDEIKKAGALAVILGWTNVSDEQARYQYTPFYRPYQDLPALWVGKQSGAQLRKLAGSGAKVTLSLEADVFPDTSTDTVIATLPGSSPDEVIIVNTHTDGSNATEENGGIGALALAKYFSKLPKSSRRRTLVFVLATGHFRIFDVPSIQGFIDKHPDVIKKTVCALTVEHLGCQEWLDSSASQYAATGKDELSLAITENGGTAKAFLESLRGTGDRRVAVVDPRPHKGPFFGEGGALSQIGIPTIGYIPIPSYLVDSPPDGCISKLSKTLLHSQLEGFAKVIHKMDTMSAAELKA